MSRKLIRIRRRLRAVGDRGTSTAEYAIATLAAAGFAALLLTILKGSAVQAMLTNIIHKALTLG